MKVRMLQQLTINRVVFPQGEIAELPTQVAIACLRRGTAQRADLPYEDRVSLPSENRVEAPVENRSSQNELGEAEDKGEAHPVESLDEELEEAVEGQDKAKEELWPLKEEKKKKKKEEEAEAE